MERKYWLFIPLALLLIAAVSIPLFLRGRQPGAGETPVHTFTPTITPTPSLSATLSPTPSPTVYRLLSTVYSDLPTVTPPAPGEPTVPAKALAMRAAPTATPGNPPTPTPLPTPTPTQTPLPTPTSVSVGGADDVLMIEIAGGEFIMGTSLEDAYDRHALWYAMSGNQEFGGPPPFSSETPSMTVFLPAFRIDQVPVTMVHYRRCVAAGVCQISSLPAANIPKDYFESPTYDDYPAIVPWYDANAYCQWVGKRLPTEAEWEKSARGTDGRLYPWGNEWDENRIATGLEPVGSRPDGASPYGVLDMLGAFPQWTRDPVQLYPGAPFQLNDRYKDNKMARGGAHAPWFNELDKIVSVRLAGYGVKESRLAFRCVQGPEPLDLATAVVSYQPIVPSPPPSQEVDLGRMVYVPAGEFLMGAPDKWLDELVGEEELLEWHQTETPQHIVYLDAFHIDKYEVTYAEYAAFLTAMGQNRFACDGYDCASVRPENANVSPDDRHLVESLDTPHQYWPAPGFENYPVEHTLWYGAQAYCIWAGKRLPTEAEWEKAARGTDGRRYPWGNEWDERSLAGARSWKIREIGLDPLDVSPYGVVDMLGNAEEWLLDWFDTRYYSVSPYYNPQGPIQSSPTVFPQKSLRSIFYGETVGRWGLSTRGSDRPHLPSTFGGIRCAYSPSIAAMIPQ